MQKGSCLCGAVTFLVRNERPTGVICHCGQCRKQSGHFWASSVAEEADIEIDGDVRWFEASDAAKRGSCPMCGSFLFWKAHDESTMSFSLGALAAPAGLSISKHIFTRDKDDYYDIADDLPQHR